MKKLLVAEASDIAEEYYISFLLDRANRTHLAMCSVEGGMEIEEVATTKPDRLAKVPVDATRRRRRLRPADRREGPPARRGARRRRGHDRRCGGVRRRGRHPGGGQPWCAPPTTRSWRWTARSPWTATPTSATDHAQFEDQTPPTRWNSKAKQHDLNYVKLDGEVGVIGNGAAW